MNSKEQRDLIHRLPASPDNFWSWVAKFDWLKVPGAVRAIARVVEGTGDAASAWIDIARSKGEQHAQSIRDATAARSRTLSEYTEAAIKIGLEDPDLISRTLTYTAATGIRQQVNREHVAAETVALISDLPPSSHEPDDDWMDIFVGYAEKANSDRLRKHWAAVLAGELRKPGSFSFATMQIMSQMDPSTAKMIEQASRWVMDADFIPRTPSKSVGEDYSTLLHLSMMGLLSLNHTKHFQPFGFHVRILGGIAIQMEFPKPITVGCALLSMAGEQIFSLASKEPDYGFADEVCAFLTNAGATNVKLFGLP